MTTQAAAPTNLPGRAEGARVQPGTVAVWFLGGAGLIVKTPRAMIYIDPYVGDGDGNPVLGGRGVPVPFDPRAVRRADAVLCTHDHTDHTDPETLKAWRDYLAPPVFGPAASTDLAREWGYPDEKLTTLHHGDSVTVNDVRITALRAYDPLAKGASGYRLDAEGVSLAHYGDSLYFPEIGEETGGGAIGTVFLSVGQNPKGKSWYMTEVDAARAARDVGAHTLVPVHWDLWRAFYLDPRRVATVARWYCPDVSVVIPRYAHKLVIGPR